ncbi:thrombospondin-type laminin G domain and EAR repeat-containing protein [Salminus brasiliensis]|uniref:thrombospondin-type laminin G domain and EAR repeat-containing protein n=1 Tax=Salminus brasiliensis TaxID=930266 RepID=UPI003B831CE0
MISSDSFITAIFIPAALHRSSFAFRADRDSFPVTSAVSSWQRLRHSANSYLLPLDLLRRVVPAGGVFQNRVRLVQSQGSRGVRFSGPPQSLSFPAAPLFTNCNYFPAEFSIVVTLKIPQLPPNKDEYIFTLLDGGSDRLLLGLRLALDKLHFLLQVRGVTRRVTFRAVGLADGRWHTLVLAVTGHYAILTVDCGVPLELQMQRPFPEDLSTEGSVFFIGSRRRWNGLFSPRLSILSVPEVLLHLPVKPPANELPLYPYEAEVRVSPAAPLCGVSETGQLWFSTEKRGLFLCDGSMWITMLQETEKLDYVEEHQDLLTISETFDIEVFSIPSVGLFMATANRDLGSTIYQWMNGRFERYQNISTHDAQAWKFFTVGRESFLVVANSGGNSVEEVSVIYKWSERTLRFVAYQKLNTHSARDWEAFHIQGEAFLAVANHRQGEMNHNIESVIYKWNTNTKRFEVNQTIATSGAYDWEFFTIGPYHFLVVANTFNGKSTVINSTIYIWLGGMFRIFQDIMTTGAIDWEMFQIGNRFFLAVANSQRLDSTGSIQYNINSTIYELNMTSQTFVKFQDITTSSALDWEFFTVGDDKFLVVANSYDGNSYSLNSVIYRWQGYERFVPVHTLSTNGCRDWEFFTSSDGSYLISSSARQALSKILKLKTHHQH